jgi:putative transposase
MTSETSSRLGLHTKHAPPHIALAEKLIFVHRFDERWLREGIACRKLNPPANLRISDEAHCLALDRGGRSLACGLQRRSRRVAMMRSKFSPREIVQKLQRIETLTAEGLPVAEALSSVGMREAEYDRWRLEYNGLERTLGPLFSAASKSVKRTRRAASAPLRKPPL